MSKNSPNKVIPFEQVISALLDNTKPFPPTYLHRFSDLPASESKLLKQSWLSINPDRRVSLMEDLDQLNDSDTLVCMDEVSKIALDDSLPRVRVLAISMLFESDDNKLYKKFLDMMQNDPDEVVRATAASALGTFVYLGELEELPEKTLHMIEDELLKVINGGDTPLVHRRALESLGFSSRDEVPALIKSAIHQTDEQWQASALFAIGRSADSQWNKEVLKKLKADGEVQFEAVRAAGELEIEEARDILLGLLDNTEDLDDELRYAIYWSLSKIGGDNVREALEKALEAANDDEEIELIQTAVENLEFTEEVNTLGLFEFEPEPEDELGHIIDIKDNPDDSDDDLEDLLNK